MHCTCTNDCHDDDPWFSMHRSLPLCDQLKHDHTTTLWSLGNQRRIPSSNTHSLTHSLTLFGKIKRVCGQVQNSQLGYLNFQTDYKLSSI